MHRYTDEQKNFILNNYKGISTKDLTDNFNNQFDTNITVSMIKSYKSRFKLNNGLNVRFKKGCVPVNKGTKGLFNKGGNKTSFKKGSIPATTVPIGTEKRLADGYVWVKIKNTPKVKKIENWIQKHRLIYEKNYGTIPKDHVVIFADGNKNNFDLDNLILVSRSELLIMNRNKLIKDNLNLTKSGVLIARLIDKTHKATKQNDE